MRRKKYFNNRKIRRQAKKVICIATLSATMLTSIPFVTYTDAYAKGQTTLEEMKALSMPTENAITYDLSDASLLTDKTVVDCFGEEITEKVIEINITKNGNYIITGNNEINGALIDTHIVVAEGVEANLIFDGAVIQNDDKYCMEIDTSSHRYNDPFFPILDIAGKANVYVKDDTSFTGIGQQEYNSKVIEVTGELVLKESDATLTLKGAYDAISGQRAGVRQHGSVTVEGGNLVIEGDLSCIDRFTMTGGTITKLDQNYLFLTANDIVMTGGTCNIPFRGANYREMKVFDAVSSITVSGGKIKVNENSNTAATVLAADHVRVSGGVFELEGNKLKLGTVYDTYGNNVKLFEITGLPGDAEVAKINGLPVKDVRTTEDGSLHTPLTYSSNLIEFTDGTMYKYDYSKDEETGADQMVKDETTPISTHQVTLNFPEENTEKAVTVADGFAIQNTYYDGENRYEYYTNANELYDGLTIHEDEELILKNKQPTATLDGEQFTGAVLPEGTLYYYKEESRGDYYYRVVYPGEPIRENTDYQTLSSEQKDGKWFVKIQSKEDFEFFTRIFYIDKPYMNLLLCADIDLSEDEILYPIYDSNCYGTIDGNGHTISNAAVPQFYFVTTQNYGTIKNIHFKNITMKSPDYNYNLGRSGIFCKANYGVIENCSVNGASIATYAKETDSNTGQVPIYDRQCEWGALAGGNFGTIKGSYAKDITFEGDGETYPIAHEFPHSTIENSYYEAGAEVETGDVAARTKEQFASGEVCSLLNQGVTDGSQVWYQNIDNDGEPDEAPVADATHATVYKGYDGCSKTRYSNSALHTTPSHEVDYTAENNVLTGVCKADPSHTVTMTLTAEDAVYDGKEHKAVLDQAYSDTWEGEEVPAEIVYTRDGKTTTDLTGIGTIKASVTMGDAVIEVTYTIKAAPTPTPTVAPAVTPTASPIVSPAVTKQPTAPSASPAVTKQPTTPTATPAVTKQPTTPTATPAVTKQPTTPTATPAVTKQPTTPTATPAVTKQPTTPTAKPTVAPTAKPTAVPTTKPTVKPTAVPTVKPTVKPTEAPAGKPDDKPTSAPAATEKPGSAASPSKAPTVIAPGTTKAPAATKVPEAVGTKIKSKKGDTYKVTNTSGKTAEIKLTKIAKNSKAKTVVIPKTVKVDGVNYKVTSIAKKAFAGNENLKTVLIGAEIEKIGAKAFYNCPNLKLVMIKSTSLKAKTVGAKAFAKIHKKAVIKVPKAKEKAYKKWLKKRGISGKQKITTYEKEK